MTYIDYVYDICKWELAVCIYCDHFLASVLKELHQRGLQGRGWNLLIVDFQRWTLVPLVGDLHDDGL